MKFIFAFFSMIIGLLCTLFWIWCIIDIVTGEFKKDTERILWLLIVILLPFIGSLLYVTIGRKQRLYSNDEYV